MSKIIVFLIYFSQGLNVLYFSYNVLHNFTAYLNDILENWSKLLGNWEVFDDDFARERLEDSAAHSDGSLSTTSLKNLSTEMCTPGFLLLAQDLIATV